MKDKQRQIKFEQTQVVRINKSAKQDDRTFAAQVRTLVDEALNAREARK